MSRSGRERADGCSLLVRNLSRSVTLDDLRYVAEKYGRLRDVYIPKDYYSGEPRGIGFVEFTDPRDAEDAIYGLDRKVIQGKEVSVVLALQGRKRPDDYRRPGGYGGSPPRRLSPAAHRPGVTAQWPDQTVLQGTALQKISQDLRPRGLLHQEATKIELTRWHCNVKPFTYQG
ncbi:hypothetical protein WJX75_008640 [Coccomyxa subellipsoidea]|uniref:RRM domain-containing protein n=1 Tax=Coccomyxa subellipsoidea TaxID=248742 RepID=A0ABR2YN97_9CHLO